MDNLQQQVGELANRIEELRTLHANMYNEISKLNAQLTGLRRQLNIQNSNINIEQETVTTAQKTERPLTMPVAKNHPQKPILKKAPSFQLTQSLEDFIGTNLISKIGILITIIGIFIGAKYAIDNKIITETMRIILGYACAITFAGIGLKLKTKYLNFSSVLMGGGIAVAYFITYIAYSFYGFFSQSGAFVMMLLTTIAAVGLALWFNQKIIALLGQLAAYCIPLLLSDGSGKVAVMFTYISIINAGLIFLSFQKNWKVLYRIAFAITWFLYASWLLLRNGAGLSFQWSLVFLTISFVTFYVTFLSYKILKKELYNLGEIWLLLANALLYYLLGYYLIDKNFQGTAALTFFTLANAVIHIAAGISIYKAKFADQTVEKFLLGLGLLFITIAIPVKLDGSWVTLLWSVEAVILVYIASKGKRSLYFEIACPLIIVALISLLQDWSQAYPAYSFVTARPSFNMPFANSTFLISLLTCASFFYIAATSPKAISGTKETPFYITQFYLYFMKASFTALLFMTIFNEINYLFDKLIYLDKTPTNNLQLLRIIILLIYSLLFTTTGLFINAKWIKSNKINNIFTVISFGLFAVMVFEGLYVLGEMREQYILAHTPGWLIWARYVCAATVAITWFALIHCRNTFQLKAQLSVIFSSAFNITLLSFICNEYINWLDLAGYQNQYKLGLSIICGVYALVILFIGLIKQKKHLRIGAMVLFGSTILKLFVYDLASLSTISKTIVMILLGVLLLVASFLYNKYKDKLLGEIKSGDED